MSKVIVITGAGTGLGKALAKRFGADGDAVVLLGRRLDKLEQTAREIGANALPISCDIGDADAVKATFRAIAAEHPKIDVLINSAATIDYSTLAEASDWHIIQTVNTNLIGNLLCSRAAINMMERGGHIINVTSESVEAPYPHHVVYQATKGGVEVMSKHLQDEIAPLGLRVSVVRAGPMLGEDRTMQASPEAVEAFFKASYERGIDISKLPVSGFSSVLWIFRALVDMPADVHVDTVRFTSRHR